MAINRTNLQEPPGVPPSSSGRLDSWKEIAAYLKFSERTVRRWEKEGLPVHRHAHQKRAGIYAYKAELDAWWEEGRARLEIERSEQVQETRSFPRWPIALSLAGLAAMAIIVLAIVFLRDRPSLKPAAPEIHSIAVLPLENLSRDPEQEYFAEGMTDELITELAQIGTLRVISRNSVMEFKGKHAPAAQIGSQLHVDALIEGTVSRSGNRVRITAQLIDANADRHLWAETYEGDLRDVLGLQDEIARDIANQTAHKLTAQEQKLFANYRAVNPAGHESYLRGLYELHGIAAESDYNLKLQSIEKAVSFFQQALARDPNDALAYAGLADAYRAQSTLFKAPMEVMPKAKAAALKAIQLDDSIAEAHASLGSVEFVFDWDWPAAQREYRKALDLNPNLPQAHADLAEYFLFIDGRPDASMQEFQRAYALDPLLPYSHGDLAWFQFLARHYGDAIETAQKIGGDDHILALALAELGQRDDAVAAAKRAMASSRNPVILSQIAAGFALAGAKDKARPLMARLEALARQRYICGFNVAGAYAALGETERAFSWLNEAFLNRSD
jgi:TolB-like protein